MELNRVDHELRSGDTFEVQIDEDIETMTILSVPDEYDEFSSVFISQYSSKDERWYSYSKGIRSLEVMIIEGTLSFSHNDGIDTGDDSTDVYNLQFEINFR